MDVFSLAAIAFIIASAAYALVRKALLCLSFAMALLVVYGLQVIASLVVYGAAIAFLSPVTFDLMVFVAPGAFSGPWTWVTFQFVHASETHLLFNLMGLVFISPFMEERVGTPAWAFLFLAGGAAGALASVLLRPSGVALVGASAGILAVFGGFARLHPRQRISLFVPLPGVPAVRAVTVLIAFLVIDLALGLVGPFGIAWEAHVVGALFGFTTAPILRRLPTGRTKADRLVSLEPLRPLATSRELAGILAEAETADLADVRDAWVEKFVRSAACPACGGPLAWRWGRLRSACGWSVRVG